MAELTLPPQLIVFDLEWTAWEGSRARQWSGADEYREIYDIGAVCVESATLEVTDTYRQLVTLEIVPELPHFSVELTGITQDNIDKGGIRFQQALPAFATFCRDLPIYAWGTDGDVVAANCQLKNIANPFQPARWHDIREVFTQYGVPADQYYSSTIVEAFGQPNQRQAHQGLDDALTIVEGLRLLRAKITDTT